MSKAIFVGVNVGFIIAYALIVNALGIGAGEIEIPTGFVAPEGGNIFDKIIAPFAWAFDAAGSFFQLTTYSFEALPPTITLFVFGPLIFVDIFLVYGMVRGGGT